MQVKNNNIQDSLIQTIPAPTLQETNPSKAKKKKTREKTQNAVKDVKVSNNNSSDNTKSDALKQISENEKQKLDLSKIFYKNLMIDKESKKHLFCVPVSQLPEALKKDFLENEGEASLDELRLEGERPQEERLKEWRKIWNIPVYEVITLKPPRIHHLPTWKFNQVFGKTLTEFLEQKASSLKKEITLVESNDNSQKKLNLEFKSNNNQAKFIDCKDNQKFASHIFSGNLKQAERIIKVNQFTLDIFDALKAHLVEIIKKHDACIPPHESMRLVWDSLSQSIIRTQKLDDEQKEKCVQALLEHWENVHWPFIQFFEQGLTGNYKSASKFLEDAINQLKNLPKFLNERLNFNHEKLCEDLKSLQSGLVKFLEKASTLELDETCDHFFKKLDNFVTKTSLDNWCSCKVYMDSSRRQLRTWLETRTDTLIAYLKMIRSDDSRKKHLLEKGQEIKKALLEQNWLLAYQLLNEICPGLLLLIVEKKYNAGALGYPTPAKEQYGFTRCLNFANALLADLQTIISQGKLFHVVSEIAYKELQRSHKELLAPIAKNEKILIPEFTAWTKKVKKAGHSELYTTLKAMQESWTKLKEIQNNLSNSQYLQDSLEILFRKIDQEEFSDLLDIYSINSQHLEELLKRWVQELKQINQNICKLQDFSMLMLTDPNLSTIDLRHIQKQFAMFNQRLAELIQPTTRFFNAFQQLICMDPNSLQGLSPNSHEISLRFTEGGAFTLNLFETKDSYFSSLAEQLAKIQSNKNAPVILEFEENIEDTVTEELIPSSTSEDVNNNLILQNPINSKEVLANHEKELSSKVKKVFQGNTKTRRIKKELTDLLKEYNLPFSKKFGKGDHDKLYVNRIPIPLPEHNEWKPGTFHSIQNTVIEQLQELIKKEKNHLI